MVASSFPIISFEPFLSGTDAEKSVVARQLYDAFHTYGWVYLKDFGITEAEIDDMFAMSKKYFDKPLELKMKHTLSSAEKNQGYTPDGAEGQGRIDHKESYEHRRFENALCPTDEECQGFRESVDTFYLKCNKLSVAVLSALSLTLGLPADFFRDALKQADPQLRLLHYMPQPRSVIEAKGHARIGAHTDFGLCTILFQDQVGGLEVDPFHTGEFRPATPIKGTCVINVADLLQRLSNDRLRSTMHRVTTPQLTKEKLAEIETTGLLPARYSTAFFVHPSADTEVDPIMAEGQTSSKYEKINAGQWRTWHTSRNYQALLGPLPGAVKV